mmetsp:Transcript_120755/g.341492  ORF Transcript_120755/g.341492 Transcript_120755/m.341492 type:complete len:236 (-) Transcript_120755:537-1244(-)
MIRTSRLGSSGSKKDPIRSSTAASMAFRKTPSSSHGSAAASTRRMHSQCRRMSCTIPVQSRTPPSVTYNMPGGLLPSKQCRVAWCTCRTSGENMSQPRQGKKAKKLRANMPSAKKKASNTMALASWQSSSSVLLAIFKPHHKTSTPTNQMAQVGARYTTQVASCSNLAPNQALHLCATALPRLVNSTKSPQLKFNISSQKRNLRWLAKLRLMASRHPAALSAVHVASFWYSGART